MDWSWVAIGMLVAIAVIGFLAGIIATRYPLAPWTVTIIIVAGFVAVNVGYGAWAERCIDCTATYDSTRGNVWALVAYLSFLATLCLIAIVWLGRFVALVFESLSSWRQK
jgi:hypothetical protein